MPYSLKVLIYSGLVALLMASFAAGIVFSQQHALGLAAIFMLAPLPIGFLISATALTVKTR